MRNNTTFTSAISNIEFPENDRVSGKTIRTSILNLILEDFPDFDVNDSISVQELNVYREKYISKFLQTEISQLSKLEKDVVRSLGDDTSFVAKVEEEVDTRNYGQIVADKVAAFGGSWTFIIAFFVFISIWIGSNVIIFTNKEFDPYPFILLNLILSCIAALQAPVIMMSQNRQEEKDRERAKKDYMINLKSELEIRMLDEKLDHLIMHQQQELIEIQKVQIENQGSVRALIKVEGIHQSTQGKQLLPFVLRLYFYENSNSIRAIHSFVYDADENHDFIKGIGFRFDALLKDFDKAEEILQSAYEKEPSEAVIYDHYGDVLWTNGKQIQARYVWQNAIKLKNIEQDLKESINKKIIFGLDDADKNKS